ncbi:hypothetical protein [Vibrio crassostreae]|uniref:hypothetical protein n=1 Tax=Vibrio crassostreae TaxID=246167 RepID=UPI0031F5A157
MNFEDVMALPEKSRGEAAHEVASAGDNDACFEYARLVFKDKYKGVKKAGQTADEMKSEARGDALRFLLEAAKRGHMPSIVEGQDAAFCGRFGAFNKVFCKVNYGKALEFLNVWLEHDISDEDKGLALLRKATCLKLTNLSDKPWGEITELWKQACELGGNNGVEASVRMGVHLFEGGKFEDAVEWLKRGDNISLSAVTHLMLIYKKHLPDPELHSHYVSKVKLMCQKKGKGE